VPLPAGLSPEALRRIAKSFTDVARGYEKADAQFRQVESFGRQAWRGQAGDAFATRMDERSNQMGAAASVLAPVPPAIEALARAVAEAQQRHGQATRQYTSAARQAQTSIVALLTMNGAARSQARAVEDIASAGRECAEVLNQAKTAIAERRWALLKSPEGYEHGDWFNRNIFRSIMDDIQRMITGTIPESSRGWNRVERQAGIDLAQWSGRLGLGGTLAGSTRVGDVRLGGSIDGFIGAQASARASVVTDGTQVSLEGRAEAHVGGQVRAEGVAEYGGVRGEVSATGRAGAAATLGGTLRASREGLAVAGQAGAFAGYEGDVAGVVSAGGVTAGGRAGLQLGIGAEARGEAEVSLRRVAISGEVSLAFGLGARLAIDVKLDPTQVVRTVERGAAEVVAAARSVPGVGQTIDALVDVFD
jgi:uncharacterized protein YukE